MTQSVLSHGENATSEIAMQEISLCTAIPYLKLIQGLPPMTANEKSMKNLPAPVYCSTAP